MSEVITGHVGSRGTITLAAETRRRYGLEDGSLFIQEERPDGILIRPAKAIPSDLSEVKVKIEEGLEALRRGDKYTIEEAKRRMDEVRARYKRSKK